MESETPPSAQGRDSSKKRHRRKTIGIAGILLVIQIFFFIPTITGTTLLPGNWTDYESRFTLYMFMDLGALGMIYGFGKVETDVREGSAADFMIRGFAWGLGTWVVMWLLFGGVFASGAVNDASAKIPILIFTVFFVGPTEELMFREVLPAVGVPWPIASGVLFAMFHIWAYGLLTFNPVQLLQALSLPFVLGMVFYWIYKWAPFGGYGAVTWVHIIYDLYVSGAITALHFAPLILSPLYLLHGWI